MTLESPETLTCRSLDPVVRARQKNMKTIASGKRWHLWIGRYQWAWFELWASWDYHNYTLSITVLTIEVGWEWVWVKSRDTLKKHGRQIIWARVP